MDASVFLSHHMAILQLPVFVMVAAAGVLVLAALVLLCFFRSRSVRRRRLRVEHLSGVIPVSTKEILKIPAADAKAAIVAGGTLALDVGEKKDAVALAEEDEMKKKKDSGASSCSSSEMTAEKKMENIGWGRWYSLAELEAATGGFSAGNVIGEGGYGIVYRGVLPDFSVVAVKNLHNNKGQAEKEFKVEVEAIGKVRHKNLVVLVGYCAEGPKRMLVYEYVDNGNLEQWLHGDVGPISPLTWDIRMKIAVATAKGITYLHEGLEPKVIHRDIKSSNILLDKDWNAKVSDFGLAKLLGSGSSYVTTRVMGTFGYVAPEYACTGMLNETHDVYSFGVLLMELVSGRSPVDYSRTAGQVNLVEWFKRMVGTKREEEIVDPLIEVRPSPRALKRVLLICLRCVDLDANKRPKMGQIVHMLEGDEFPFRLEHRLTREGITKSLAAATRFPVADSEKSMWR